MESNPEIPEDLEVKFNSPEGVLWLNTARATKDKIESGKIEAELQGVVLAYCEKKVEEDRKSLGC